MAVFEPEPATDTELVAAHTPEYIAKVRAVSSLGGFLAESTYLSPGSYSQLSAGAGISAVKGILSGRFASALS